MGGEYFVVTDKAVKKLKKPFISLKNKKDKFSFLFALLLCVSASLLFFLPDRSLTVFSDGKDIGIKGLFNLLNGWI